MNANLPITTSLLATFALAATATAGGGADGTTERLSFKAGGIQMHTDLFVTDVTPDGRYVVVRSEEALVPQDDNGVADVYVLDTLTDVVQLASVNFQGAVGNGISNRGRISDDGRYVAFHTAATNLVGIDLNGELDVVRKDLTTGLVALVSAPIGSVVTGNNVSRAPDISADGRYVAFESRASNLHPDSPVLVLTIYRRDMQAGVMAMLTYGVGGPSTGDSFDPSISADGSRVAYVSASPNLVLFDSNSTYDVFVQDVGSAPKLVSTTPGGWSGNSSSLDVRLSRDGQYVAFGSHASDLVPGDTNSAPDVFLAPVGPGATQLVSRRPDLGPANSGSYLNDVSTDGRYVSFQSQATDLTPDGLAVQGVYVHDTQTLTTALASRPSGSTALPNSDSYVGLLSGDAGSCVFLSDASNLDQGDTNGTIDVFRRTFSGGPLVYCTSAMTSAGCVPQLATSGSPSASAASGFDITCADVPNQQIGVLIYGFEGAASAPILGGTLCLSKIAGRSPGLFTGGNPGSGDCSGQFTIDMNAYAAGALGGSPAAALSLVGQQVNAQFWGRDPASVVGYYFSEAVEYVVGL